MNAVAKQVYEGIVAEISKLEHFTSASAVLGRPGCLCLASAAL